ncbi:MAG: asparaginase, partial [Anaerolineales bacterium]|nr:asparaginase [Anaerolineales bacterium]
AVSEILRNANVNIEYDITPLLRKDSLEIIDEDRALIVERIRNDPNKRILITHGTDTMVQTANALSEIQGKTIVLTGAMQPAACRITDAAFNIGCAIIATQILPEGVFIVMNGKVFNPSHVRKDNKRNLFIEVD